MKTIVSLAEKSYYIQIENNFDSLELNYKKVLVITDSNVDKYHTKCICDVLKKKIKEVYICVFEAGEINKNLNTVSDIYYDCCKYNLDRKSCIIALGGGVTGDMAGFVAATFLRGIDYIQVPTTLLAQADSSVGGKTGVDFAGGKNIIGAFWQPKLVYMNLSTFNTLPQREYNAGMAEVIKHGLIHNKEFYGFITDNKNKIKDRDFETVSQMVSQNCLIKADVVSKDEKETNLRAILNFGHTIGHAVESGMDFKLLHGECVAIGMITSLYISFLRGKITENALKEIEDLLLFFELPIRTNCLKETILSDMKKDKKRENNTQKFILIDEIGSCGIYTDITEEELDQAINYITQKGNI